MSEGRIATELWVMAHVRQCITQGIIATVVKRGDDWGGGDEFSGQSSSRGGNNFNSGGQRSGGGNYGGGFPDDLDDDVPF